MKFLIMNVLVRLRGFITIEMMKHKNSSNEKKFAIWRKKEKSKYTNSF